MHDTKGQAGAKITVTGTLTSYYGEKELEITSETVDDSTITPITPTVVTPGVAVSNDSISKYIKTQGTVSNVVKEADGTVDSFTLTGADGSVPVEINDTSNVDLSFVKDGATVSVTGFGSRFITGGKPGDNIDWGDTNSNLNVRVADRSLITLVSDGSSNGNSNTKKPLVPFVKLPAVHSGMPFIDSKNNQFKNDIAWVYGVGVTTGYNATHFGPNDNITRGQMAAFLYRLAGSPKTSAKNPFKDVKQFSKEIAWIKSVGVTTGYTPTTYGPNDYVTRGQMAAFLHRLAVDMDIAPKTGTYTSSFTDIKGNQFANDINWLKSTGITTGFTKTSFQPNGKVTRGQMAAFLHRFYNYAQSK